MRRVRRACQVVTLLRLPRRLGGRQHADRYGGGEAEVGGGGRGFRGGGARREVDVVRLPVEAAEFGGWGWGESEQVEGDEGEEGGAFESKQEQGDLCLDAGGSVLRIARLASAPFCWDPRRTR